MSELPEEEDLESIAIIGMAGSYPGARNLDEFWDNLCQGVESISEFTIEEHEKPSWAPQDLPWVRARGNLPDPELFDAGFFGYSPEEAKMMDPQQRVFLEKGWEAIEHAGYDPNTTDAVIGVFAGVSSNTYVLATMRAGSGFPAFTDRDFLATRLSYKLNLTGPSVVVQSACSTSLVAVCLAGQSLLSYECDLALAGGSSIWVPLKSGYPWQPGMPVSPDGHTRSFDAEGRGFVPGSGVGAVFLKRLSEARADGDHIWAVIKGFAVNNDGAAKIGYTAPSVTGQARAIATAQRLAGIDPSTITYVEAHGTGTELGDPIEIAALTEAFRASTDETGFCAVGSVKPNIGHPDAAAGIASLHKTVLALYNRQIPPSLNFDTPNPKIDFDSSPFFVNDKLIDWKGNGSPLRAGVSAFGIGGTNAHVVLEEAPATEPAGETADAQLIPVSARTTDALAEASLNLAHFLESEKCNLADVAFTLQNGRRSFDRRRFVVAVTPQEAARDLVTAPRTGMSNYAPEGTRQVVFMFTGQGAQYPGMTKDLYDREEVFRAQVDTCCEFLSPILGLDLRTVIYPEAADEAAAERLTRTAYAQPALFVVEYALAKLWASWGVEPAACIGHSVGEFVAACLAGVFSLEDGLRMVARRAQLMDQMPPGAMLAVRMSEEEASRLATDDVVLAALNAPDLSVLSGPVDQIDALQSRLEKDRVATIRLKTSHAFHSPMMEPILEPFRQFVAGIDLSPPTLPYVSNLTGQWISAEQATDPGYWAAHLRRPVRFTQGVESLLSDHRVLLEVGPGRTLTGLAAGHPGWAADQVVASLGQARAGSDERAILLKAAGQLWLAGAGVDFNALHKGRSTRRVPLPTYPFQRQRYWALDDATDPFTDPGPQWNARKDPGTWFYAPSWKRLPAGSSPEVTGVWLVLANESGLGVQVAEEAEAAGATVATVMAGTEYRAADSLHYQIDPLSAEHYVRVLQDLASHGLVPDHIAHMWSVSGRGADIRTGRSGFYSLLYLAQALGQINVSTPVNIVVFTDGALSVSGDEPITAEKLLVQGPCRVIPQEFPNLSCTHIDLSPAEMDAMTAARLIEEVASEPSEPVLALRGRYRWAQSFEPVHLEPPSESESLIHERGVYLITGGLGGIGLVFAQWLAESAQARLVLTARTALPEREAWSHWLESHPDDSVSRRIRSIQGLEEAGSEVLVIAADTADEAAMREVVEAAVDRFGTINGAIHSAGVAGGGIVQLKTMEIADKVLRPKVEGLRVLNRVLEEQPLDFVVLCSSMTALLGGFGQVDYCAANSFMDGVAWESRAAGGPPVISINWTAWREVGMAVETDLPENLREITSRLGESNGMLNREGVDALRRILDHWREPQVAISLTDPNLLKRQWKMAEEVAARNLAPVEIRPRPELRTSYEEPSTETERRVAEVWQKILGFSQVGRNDDFFELGGHSLLAVQLLRPLQEAFDINLPMPALFEHSTIQALARYIDTSIWATAGPGDGEPETDGREEITL